MTGIADNSMELDSLGEAGRALKAKVAQAYAAQSKESLQEQWIVDHLPLVKHVVQKIAHNLPRGIEMEDLISAGTLGLVRAARAYDPNRDAEFKTYAYIRIRGSVIDELRGRSFVPSAVHKQFRQVQEAFSAMSSELGRSPSDEELAARLAMSQEDLYAVLSEARCRHFLSIHGLSDEQTSPDLLSPLDSSPSPSDQLERKEMAERLAGALRELPERDRLIILLYYERDLTMKEIAQVLKVTESRVSQLHAGALFRLAMRMRTPP